MIIFVHIPKTAGSSIIHIISSNPNYKIKGHYPKIKKSIFFKDKICTKDLNIQSVVEYKFCESFSVVRNPYDRFLSAYNYLIKGGGQNNLDLSYQRILSKYKNMDDVIKNLKHLRKIIVHFVPQHKFICDKSGNLLVNKCIKFENVKNELIAIDGAFKNIPTHNASERSENFLTERQKKIIYQNYKMDFIAFGY